MQVLKALFSWFRNLHPLFLILGLGAIHGIAYLWLVPPWQHYDEPTHFEYAWWIANRGSLPEPDSFDSIMRREVAASMLEHHFFDRLQPPSLLLDKPWIGLSQTEDPPVYYLFASIPLWFLRGADITVQLHAARLVSFSMFLLTLAVIFWVMEELFPQHPPLHWLVPIFIALIPAFVDLMTAVNNDVGAVLFFTIFLWAGVRFIKRRVTFFTLTWLFISVTVCFFTKSTVLIAIPAGVLLLVLKLFHCPSPWKHFGYPILFILVVGTSLLGFSRQDAAFWYRMQTTVQHQTGTQTQTPTGEHTLIILYKPDEKNALALTQPLFASTIQEMRGKSFTLGGWIWASEPVQAQLPTLVINGEATFQTVQITQTPTFYAMSGMIPENSQRILVLLDPLVDPLQTPISFYFDNLILIEGVHSSEIPPQLSKEGDSGTWERSTFTNLIRNATATETWVTIRPALLFPLRKETNFPPYSLPALQDLSLTRNIYQNALKNLFDSFWARFGWNQVGLPQLTYSILQGFTLFGLLATGASLFLYKPKHENLTTLLWFTFCASLAWGTALARQTLPYWEDYLFTPSARYTYPVILPTALWLVAGWYAISLRVKNLKPIYLPIAFLSILDITSLIIIFQFYSLV